MAQWFRVHAVLAQDLSSSLSITPDSLQLLVTPCPSDYLLPRYIFKLSMKAAHPVAPTCSCDDSHCRSTQPLSMRH